MPKLTKRVIDAIEPGARREIHYDSELKGFGLKVTPTGAMSWCVEYRPGAGGRGVSKRRMVLGSTGKLTPEQARHAARDVLARVALGEDPAAVRAGSREMPTFSGFAERYLAEEAAAKLKPRTVANYCIYLRKHAVPRIGSRKLDMVTSSELVKMHRSIGQTRPMTANRVVEFIGSVYRFAATSGLVKRGHNPASDIKAFREQRRERFLTSEEFARLGDAIREAETTGIPWIVDEAKPTAKHIPKDRVTKIDQYSGAALRLLIFTGARLQEILQLKWEFVDFERGLLLLPESKTGRKTIVLNAPALAILAGLPRGGPYVIVGADPETPRHDLNRPWKQIRKRAGLEGVRIHDLRHSFASIGVGGGLGLPIVGKLLGQSSPATTARYAHLDNDPLRRASNSIGAQISASLDGTFGASVSPLRKASNV
jgi:integrase